MTRRRPGGNRRRPRKPNRGRACPSGKVRFRDLDEAKRAVQRLSVVDTRDRTPNRTYRCELCSGWHLTAARQHGDLDDDPR